ncbi:2025_t:CDS:1, partial [Gigaspora rosea]
SYCTKIRSEPSKHVDLRVIRIYLLVLNAEEQSLLLLWVHLTNQDRDGVKNWLCKEEYNTNTFLGFDD